MSEGEKAAAPVRRKGFLKAAFERGTSAFDGGGPRELPRAKLSFVVDHTACLPGVFDEDFEITLRTTSTAEEEAIGAACRSAPEKAGKLMAIRMLWRVNGEPIETGQDEWLWEMLGPSGRMLVMAKVAELTRPGDAAQGKAHETTSIG